MENITARIILAISIVIYCSGIFFLIRKKCEKEIYRLKSEKRLIEKDRISIMALTITILEYWAFLFIGPLLIGLLTVYSFGNNFEKATRAQGEYNGLLFGIVFLSSFVYLCVVSFIQWKHGMTYYEKVRTKII